MGSPTPGWYSWRFLEDEIGLGADQGETIGNLLEWSRAEMEHMAGGGSLDDFEYYWGYRYAIPLRAVLEGTDPEGFLPSFIEGWDIEYDVPFAHHTYGCQGTSSMMYTVLRAANIPAVHLRLNYGHAYPWFAEVEQFLTHGDDPYSRMVRSANYFASELLIDRLTYNTWILEPEKFVGRRVQQLSAIRLPYELLEQHYSLQALEDMGFWQNLDAEVAAEGGCEVISPDEQRRPLSALVITTARGGAARGRRGRGCP